MKNIYIKKRLFSKKLKDFLKKKEKYREKIKENSF